MKESLISSGEWNRGLSQGAQELAVDSLKKSANASLLQLDNDIFCVGAGNSCCWYQGERILPGTNPTHCTWYTQIKKTAPGTKTAFDTWHRKVGAKFIHPYDRLIFRAQPIPMDPSPKWVPMTGPK